MWDGDMERVSQNHHWDVVVIMVYPCLWNFMDVYVDDFGIFWTGFNMFQPSF